MALTPERVDKLTSQAKALSIGYFVVGGLMLLAALGGLFFMGVGVFFLFLSMTESEEAFIVIGVVYSVMGAIFTLLLGALGVLDIVVGVRLQRMRGRVLAIVAAILNLMNQPLGLVLGIFTLIYLFQSDVDTLFSGEDPDLLT